MKKFVVLLCILMSGCLTTQNRQITMRTPSNGQPSSINSAVPMVANPKTDCDRELEYFEKNTILWPKTFKATPAPCNSLTGAAVIQSTTKSADDNKKSTKSTSGGYF